MAVVINEFEVVTGAVGTSSGRRSERGGGEGAPQPSEHEIEKLVELQMSRCERVWAY